MNIIIVKCNLLYFFLGFEEETISASSKFRNVNLIINHYYH